ncbi:MAG: NADH-quinone oxidoreductase subunit C [Puniceicoccales bacterium]|jgi:NADH-quinone oxidoreductase subunit C|nr:NADH-quinone oxidoreductase subunit C [Puniceicoccales bacterium]
MSTTSPEEILTHLLEKFPEGSVSLVKDTGSAMQHSLLLQHEKAVAIANTLRDDPQFRFDYCSNVTGMDWPKEGFLEAVYHLYSIEKKTAKPLILRMRTKGRDSKIPADLAMPSFTSVWRSCELQEREVYDLYGILYSSHPDLRRLLMWDEFQGHPMRKDYAPPAENPPAA